MKDLMALLPKMHLKINAMFIQFASRGDYLFPSDGECWHNNQLMHIWCKERSGGARWPTYTLSCTASVCFRHRVTLPTDTPTSLTEMPGWYIWQKCWA